MHSSRAKALSTEHSMLGEALSTEHTGHSREPADWLQATPPSRRAVRFGDWLLAYGAPDRQCLTYDMRPPFSPPLSMCPETVGGVVTSYAPKRCSHAQISC
jgi:hypothetical protein